jgi:hypothetical protein
MPIFTIVSLNTGYKYGQKFMTVLKFPLDTDDEILFKLNGVEQVGTWFSDGPGFEWIIQTDRAIRVTEEADIWIVGVIVPLDEKKPCWN